MYFAKIELFNVVIDYLLLLVLHQERVCTTVAVVNDGMQSIVSEQLEQNILEVLNEQQLSIMMLL